MPSNDMWDQKPFSNASNNGSIPSYLCFAGAKDLSEFDDFVANQTSRRKAFKPWRATSKKSPSSAMVTTSPSSSMYVMEMSALGFNLKSSRILDLRTSKFNSGTYSSLSWNVTRWRIPWYLTLMWAMRRVHQIPLFHVRFVFLALFCYCIYLFWFRYI